MADADCAVQVPGCLESHARSRFVALDADAVEEVDRGAVAVMAYTVAAVVGADQTHPGLIIRRQRAAVGRLAPRLVAKADTFALGATGTGDQEPSRRGHITPVDGERAGEGKAEPAPIRVLLTVIAPLSALRVLLGKRVEHHLTFRVARIALDGIDADPPLLPGAVAEREHGAGQALLRRHRAVAQRKYGTRRRPQRRSPLRPARRPLPVSPGRSARRGGSAWPPRVPSP